MLSSADQQAMGAPEKSKVEVLKTLVFSLLENWDKNLIVFREKITFALESKNEKGRSHQDKNAEVEKIISLHKEVYDPIDAIDLLYELLTTCSGSYGPHSFKFALLKGLFNLSLDDQTNSHQIIEFFVSALIILKDQQRKTFVKEMVASIRTRNISEFGKALCAASDLKTGMDAKISNLFYGYTLIARHFFALDIKEEIENKRISILDATYNLFNMPLAQEGQHSFKFIFLLHLFGYKLTSTITDATSLNHSTMHVCLTIPEDQKTPVSQFLYSVFVKGNKEEAMYIIKELIIEIERVRNILSKKRYTQATGFVELFFGGNITKQLFIHALTIVRAHKDKEEADKSAASSSEALKFFSSIVKRGKIEGRSQQLDDMIRHLALPTTNMLKELITFLETGPGSNGPHSFKYRLLKQLFPDLNNFEVSLTEVVSVATIQLFIKLAKKRLAQTFEGVPLTAVKIEDSESDEELPKTRTFAVI